MIGYVQEVDVPVSHTWPENDSQIPINYGDKEYDPLFPFGFGLHYEE